MHSLANPRFPPEAPVHRLMSGRHTATGDLALWVGLKRVRLRENGLSARRLQSGDHRDDLVLLGLLRLRYANLLAAPEYADVIRKAEYLVKTVANDEDRQIARLQPGDQVLHFGRFCNAKSCSRLVHQNQIRGPMGRAGDCDSLSLTP
jgi:hypothetical protein